MVVSLNNPLLGFCTKEINNNNKKIQIRLNQTNNKIGGYYGIIDISVPRIVLKIFKEAYD